MVSDGGDIGSCMILINVVVIVVREGIEIRVIGVGDLVGSGD